MNAKELYDVITKADRSMSPLASPFSEVTDPKVLSFASGIEEILRSKLVLRQGLKTGIKKIDAFTNCLQRRSLTLVGSNAKQFSLPLTMVSEMLKMKTLKHE